jgi:hypothetical protein
MNIEQYTKRWQGCARSKDYAKLLDSVPIYTNVPAFLAPAVKVIRTNQRIHSIVHLISMCLMFVPRQSLHCWCSSNPSECLLFGSPNPDRLFREAAFAVEKQVKTKSSSSSLPFHSASRAAAK